MVDAFPRLRGKAHPKCQAENEVKGSCPVEAVLWWGSWVPAPNLRSLTGGVFLGAWCVYVHNFSFTPFVRSKPVWLWTADAPKGPPAEWGEKKGCTMAASRMQLLSPRNISLFSRGRTDLLAGGGGARRAGDGPRGRSFNCSPLSSRTFSSVSETRRGLPREKMTENGASSKAKVLTIDTMNPRVKKVEYAVRGPIVQRAVELERELSQVLTICLNVSTRLGKSDYSTTAFQNLVAVF